METTTAKKTEVKTPVIVNFLRTDQKHYDWRYKTYKKLYDNYEVSQKRSETIYWLGILDLLPVIQGKTDYPVQFTTGNLWRSKNDTETLRDVDGCELSCNHSIFYHFSPEIMNALFNARNKGCLFFHILLEEKVDYTGLHSISLLYNPDKPEYGFPTKNPWFELPAKEFMEFSHTVIPEKTKRVQLVGNHPYNWMK